MTDNKRMVEFDKLEQKFQSLINNKEIKEAHVLLQLLNEVDIASLIGDLDPKTALVLFRMLPKDEAAEVFAYFDSDMQEAIISASTDKEIKEIIDELYMDDYVDMIEEMPSNVVNRILKNATAEDRKIINEFLHYPEDSAGSIMTIEYVSLKKEMNVREALQKIKREGIDKETIYTLYVTDDFRRLEGILSLREMITSDYETKIEDLMEDEVIYAQTNDDREEVAALFRKYGFEAIPIVDNEKRIVGIVTVDDIIDVIEEETTEDFQVMAGTTPSEEPYLETSSFELAKHRIPWLLVLMISSTVTQKIMNYYESYISLLPFLAGFIPMLMDTGGNSGSQSSTLVIRGMAIGEIRHKDWFKVMLKELKVAILCATVLAIVNYFKIIYIDKATSSIALTVSLTLIVSVCSAKLVGGLLPLLASKLKMDPAIMASPLITTIADAMSLLSYFFFARNIINI